MFAYVVRAAIEGPPMPTSNNIANHLKATFESAASRNFHAAYLHGKKKKEGRGKRNRMKPYVVFPVSIVSDARGTL